MSRHLFLGTRFAAWLAGYWLMDDELVDTQRFIDTIRDCDGIERSAHSKTHSKLQIHLTMKHIPNIAAGLLGLAFVIFGAISSKSLNPPKDLPLICFLAQ